MQSRLEDGGEGSSGKKIAKKVGAKKSFTPVEVSNDSEVSAVAATKDEEVVMNPLEKTVLPKSKFSFASGKTKAAVKMKIDDGGGSDEL